MIKEILERSTYTIRASFIDDDEAAVVPTSGAYRVDDITNGVRTEVIDTTAFTPLNSYYDISIPSASNAILDESHDYEARLVTVTFLYGGGQRGVGEYEYTIKNSRAIGELLG